MAEKKGRGSPVVKREPLGDGTMRANINHPTRRTRGPPSSPSASSVHKLPHHESLMPNAPHNVRNVTPSAEHKRLPLLRDEDDSKRDSQVSTTSTIASGKGRRRKTHIGPWQLGSDVGKGGCGKVRKVRHVQTNEVAAVKIISKKVAEKERAESLVSLVERTKRGGTTSATGHNIMPFGIEREVVIMKLLEHRNVVRLLDVWENRNELYLVMEFVNGGELLEHIERCEYLDEDETVWIFRQTLAALLHCHRLGIHHRDLKPENILLQITPDDTIEVKLVDFGMAALQPRGKLLTTPCGSVHYAAPEVFEKCYDGNKVDVWSLGVILYVMLLGRTPFSMPSEDSVYDSTVWCALIKSGRYDLPEHLSSEAKDLIRKMLVPNPKLRISLESVWHHPLLHKYETEWGESSEMNTLFQWIGQAQRVGTWNIKERKDIDREILRNLRTLWHSEKEEVLIANLLDNEINKEKEFYAALLKHREDQLENYVGTPDSVGQSSSDYHHTKQVSQGPDVPKLPPSAYDRTKSQYSILNEEKSTPKRNSSQSLPSVRSYDPFRASYIPVPVGKVNRAGYTVHRIDSGKTNVKHQTKPLGPRVEALRGEERRFSAASTTISNPELGFKTVSRASMLSSAHSSSSRTSGPVRPNIGHKRGVSFSHLHRSSSASVGSVKSAGSKARKTIKIPTTPAIAQVIRTDEPSSPGSPRPLTSQVVVSRKAHPAKKQVANPHIEVFDKLINSEARKVSTELEKICDEAFKYSDSSARTSATTAQAAYETPPSSVSNRASARSFEFPLSSDDAGLDTSTLPTTAETPGTYIAREIAETRRRLAERYNQDPSAHKTTYSEVLAHLDALLDPAAIKSSAHDTGRNASMVEQRYAPYSYLPVISEENRSFDGEEADTDHYKTLGPTAKKGNSKPFKRPIQDTLVHDTIRMIYPSSPAPQIAPLVIRKFSGIGSDFRSDQDKPVRFPPEICTASRSQTPASTKLQVPVFRSSITEDALLQLRETPLPKKRGWFRRRIPDDTTKPAIPSSPKAWDDLDDRMEKSTDARRHGDNIHSRQSFSKANEGMTALPHAGKKPLFLRLLGRSVAKPKNSRMALGTDDDDNESNRSTTALSLTTTTTSAAAVRDGLHPTDLEPRDLGVQRNWLACFFNIKPATATMCFQAGRGIARHRLMKLLTSAKGAGMRDVELDRARNLIFARLDGNNAYGIKEVSFVAQLYVVLVNGRRAQLCLARFTQRRGAASSFRKIMAKIEEVFDGVGILVQDVEQRKGMMAMLGGI